MLIKQILRLIIGLWGKLVHIVMFDVDVTPVCKLSQLTFSVQIYFCKPKIIRLLSYMCIIFRDKKVCSMKNLSSPLWCLFHFTLILFVVCWFYLTLTVKTLFTSYVSTTLLCLTLWFVLVWLQVDWREARKLSDWMNKMNLIKGNLSGQQVSTREPSQSRNTVGEADKKQDIKSQKPNLRVLTNEISFK